MKGREVRFGSIDVDVLSMSEAVEAVAALVRSGRGGAVFTPNVDHVVQAEEDPRFREAYARADVSVADGMPLVWASRLLGTPLPERVSGTDLVAPLLKRAAAEGWRVFLLGGGPGVAERAAFRIASELGVNVVGTNDAWVSDPLDPVERQPLVRTLREASAELVLVGMGAPKQELWIDAARADTGPAVMLGIGAALDFLAGTQRRAPLWMQRAGLEWLHRLLQEPQRLWRRYLLRDPKFFAMVLRDWRARRRLAV